MKTINSHDLSYRNDWIKGANMKIPHLIFLH